MIRIRIDTIVVRGESFVVMRLRGFIVILFMFFALQYLQKKKRL